MSPTRVVTPIPYGVPFETTISELVARLAGLDRSTALLGGGPTPDGRFSVFAHRPIAEWIVPAGAPPEFPPSGAWSAAPRPGPDVFDRLRTFASALRATPGPFVGPFVGGVIAILGYDLRTSSEPSPDRKEVDPTCPDLLARRFSAALVHDAETGRATVMRLVDPADPKFTAEAAERAEELFATGRGGAATAPPPAHVKLVRPVSTDAPETYRAKVARVIEHVRAGDVYQLNLSQRFEGACADSGPDVARRLLATNPSAFGGLVRLPGEDAWLVSASPESFLEVFGRDVATRPIKGTAPRGADAAEDARFLDALQASPKERAELAMIVDLLRNDLSTCCEPGSVVVENPWAIETHPTVHHMTATVRGRLREDADLFDLLRSAWPGGSISGCPKIRATELIEEIEAFRRGPYTGSLAAFSCDGRTRLNILIRSATIVRGRARTWGGGGLTFDSDPEAERKETLHKIRGLCAALGWETPT